MSLLGRLLERLEKFLTGLSAKPNLFIAFILLHVYLLKEKIER